MLVKQLNWYLNECLRIMANEQDSNCIALEAILLLIYVWNQCLVQGTAISHCMEALGRKFSFHCISQVNWDVLFYHKLQFMNLVPQFNKPSYSINVNQGLHTTTCDPSHVAALCAVSDLSDDCNCLYLWQKVIRPFNLTNLSRTQKSYNQNLLYQEMSTRSGSNLVLCVPINFYSYTCNNIY